MAHITIKDLIKLWEEEKEQYKTAEIGTGVQKFVKHVFECNELFNFKEGKLSTDDLNRKNEFLTEAKKKGRRADIVIFIDSAIIIPVEVEKFTYIKNGIQQIYNYQSDWTKKYGLLTDGNEWWFYNNRFIEKRFFIKDILEKPKEFLAYWKEYTTANFYYRSFFEKKGQQTLFEEPIPPLDNVREDFFTDITSLIKNFENKLNLKGYFDKKITAKDIEIKTEKGNVKKDETEKKAVEITYAYLIQYILYKVLVDNAFADFDKDWVERLKSIDTAIKAEAYGDVLTKIKGISDKISDKIYKRFNDEQLIINDKLKEILSAPKTNIGDVSVWLDIMLFINRYNFADVKNEIFGYVYENYLKDLYDEKKGQYFTDPHVVTFMLNEMGYTKENLQKRYAKDNDSISIIDPSCGSGTFLYTATQRLVESFFDDSLKSSKLTEQLINDNIFGIDVAEFPLYLAEMNILMRMLPIIINETYNNPVDQKLKIFITNDSIAEFTNTALNNTITDISTAFKKGKSQFDLFSETLELGYDSFMRDKGDLDNLKDSLEIKNNKDRIRFDFVIGNPPYISYNECASQHLQFFEFIKERKVQLNNVYGVNLHSVPGFAKKGRPNPNLYLFFISLGLAMLKDDGVISYIIPQNLLTAGDFDVMRYHLSKYTTIEKIITFKNALFVGRGIQQKNKIATSSLIFVIKKSIPLPKNKVEVVSYNNPNKDVIDCIKDLSKRKNVTTNKISQKQLLKNFKNWNFIKFNDNLIELFDYYNSNSESLDNYYQHSLAKVNFNTNFYFDGGYSIDESKRVSEIPDEPYYIYPKFNPTTFTGINHNGYWPNQRNEKLSFFIDLRQGNQGYNLLDSPYKIIWSYQNPSKFYFTDEKVIWARNQFNGIGSINSKELLYLFALLNSTINFKILTECVKSENEMDILFSLTSLKNFIRIPIINETNNVIKKEVIKITSELINLEKQKFSNLVDFKTTLLQKFETLEVVNTNLIIKYKDKEAKCKILANPNLVKAIVSNLNNNNLLNQDNVGSVAELKMLSAFDKEYQAQLKNYIDDLVYAMYFNVNLTNLGFKNASQINTLCQKNKYYNLVNIK